MIMVYNEVMLQIVSTVPWTTSKCCTSLQTSSDLRGKHQTAITFFKHNSSQLFSGDRPDVLLIIGGFEDRPHYWCTCTILQGAAPSLKNLFSWSKLRPTSILPHRKMIDLPRRTRMQTLAYSVANKILGLWRVTIWIYTFVSSVPCLQVAVIVDKLLKSHHWRITIYLNAHQERGKWLLNVVFQSCNTLQTSKILRTSV